MKRELFVVIFIIAAVTISFAQSNYELLLSRPDIAGLTGIGAIEIDNEGVK